MPTTSVTMPAGFCPIQAGEAAVFTLSEDGFTPACLTVQANQAVEVVNRTGASVVVTLAGVLDRVDVEPGGRVRSPASVVSCRPASYPLVAGAITPPRCACWPDGGAYPWASMAKAARRPSSTASWRVRGATASPARRCTPPVASKSDSSGRR